MFKTRFWTPEIGDSVSSETTVRIAREHLGYTSCILEKSARCSPRSSSSKDCNLLLYSSKTRNAAALYFSLMRKFSQWIPKWTGETTVYSSTTPRMFLEWTRSSFNIRILSVVSNEDDTGEFYEILLFYVPSFHRYPRDRISLTMIWSICRRVCMCVCVCVHRVSSFHRQFRKVSPTPSPSCGKHPKRWS